MARGLNKDSADHQLNNKVTSGTQMFKAGSKLFAAACLVSAASTFAAEPVAKNPTATTASKDASRSDGAPIPESIDKLNLTTKQQEQIREIVREYDESINSVWNQYRDRYMQTIVVETTLLAAVEDGLSDAQRQQIRTHRKTTAQHKRMNVATSNKSDTTINKTDGDNVDPVKESPDKDLKVDVGGVGVTLTRDQESAADKVHQKYRTHLRSLNRDIHNLHTRLLSLEADKLAEIESVLTKEQVTQLRANRQNAPEAMKMTIGQTDR